MPTAPCFPPTVDDFKAFFNRDFIYGDGLNTVQDNDITRALCEAPMMFNGSLFESIGIQRTAFLYLSAHIMVRNVQAAGGLRAVNAGKGAQNQGAFALSAATVGGVSTTAAIPDWATMDDIAQELSLTDYGKRYYQMVSQRNVAPGFVVPGDNGTGGGPWGNPETGLVV